MARASKFPDEQTAQLTLRLSDPDRLDSLRAAGLLDTGEEQVFDRAVRLASRITGAPVGLLSLVDGKRQFFKAHTGLFGEAALTRETPLTHSFCQYVVAANEPLAVRDAREHDLLRENLAIADMDVVAYLGIPVRAHDGQPIGSFCTIDHQPREWTDQDLDALTDVAAIVENELELRRKNAMSELLIGELNHRIKNVFALTSGMVNLTAREAQTTQAMREELTGRLQALAHAHELIRPAITNEAISHAVGSLRDLVGAILRPHADGRVHPPEHDGPDVALGPQATTSLALVLHEMTTNAVKYGALSVPMGRLSIGWTIDGNRIVLVWRESDGPEVRAQGGKGFGGRLIEMSVTGQLRGTITSTAAPAGMVHRIELPVAALQR